MWTKFVTGFRVMQGFMGFGNGGGWGVGGSCLWCNHTILASYYVYCFYLSHFWPRSIKVPPAAGITKSREIFYVGNN